MQGLGVAHSLLPPQPPNGSTVLDCSATDQREVLSQINILKCFLLFFFLFVCFTDVLFPSWHIFGNEGMKP